MRSIKLISFIFLLVISFACFHLNVSAGAPDSFTMTRVDAHQTIAGVRIAYKFSGDRVVYCIDYKKAAPTEGCTYYKTQYWTNDAGFISIITYPNKSGESGRWNYHVKEAAVYKYLWTWRTYKMFYDEKNKKWVSPNDIGLQQYNLNDNSKKWKEINRAQSRSKQIVNLANKATPAETSSSLKVNVDKNGKSTCSDGKVISQTVTIVGNNVDFSTLKVSVGGVSGAQIINKNTSGNIQTFNISVPQENLKEKKTISISASANSNDDASKYYVYRPSCGDDVVHQNTVILDSEPVVVSGSNSFKMDNSACNVNDYTIDAACIGCDDTEKSANRSTYIIQDTNNWEAILRSDDSNYVCDNASQSQKQNLARYFKTTTNCGNIYCREEVKVIFPNANDTPSVERGRYFTVHSPFRDENKLVKNPYSPDYNESVAILNETKYDHNWGSIKIQKIKECRMISRKGLNEKNCIRSNQGRISFNNNPADVYLTYRGNAKDKTDADKNYENTLTNLKLDVEPNGEYGSAANTTTTDNYTAFTSENKKVSSGYMYKEVQTSSYKLPGTTFRFTDKKGGVFESTKTGDASIDIGIATIPVSPNNEVYSEEDAKLSLSFKLDDKMHLYNSFTKDNTYLPSCTIKSVKSDSTNIYQYVVSKGKITSKTVSGMNESKKVDELAQSACAKMYLCSKTSDGIKCNRAGVDSCIKNRTINKIGNDNNSNCYVKNTPQNGLTNYVCGLYVEPGIPEIPDVPVPECPGCVDPDPNFKKDPGPDPEKCVVTLSNNVCVPSTGVSNIIYRTIDLDNPFPGMTGSNRYTGVNWCQYNPETRVYSCGSQENNKVVDKYILNNRGVDGDAVYNLTPMYTVELDGQTIKAIKSYNAGTSYDDFNLTCNDKGQECTSKFVDRYVTKNCNNFGSCDNG